jgi:hypothetical protein
VIAARKNGKTGLIRQYFGISCHELAWHKNVPLDTHGDENHEGAMPSLVIFIPNVDIGIAIVSLGQWRFMPDFRAQPFVLKASWPLMRPSRPSPSTFELFFFRG